MSLFCSFSHPLSVEGGFCQECALCYLCHKTLSPAEYFFCLREAERDSDPDAGIISNPVFVHPSCFSEAERSTLASETVTIPRELFNKLNACRLLIEPLKIGGMKDEDVLQSKTQEQDAGVKATWFIHESAKSRSSEDHQEYLYSVLRRMESCAATLSLAVSKQRRSIELNLDKKVAKQNLEAREERQRHTSHKTPKTEARTERRQLSQEERAIERIQKLLSCTLEEAKIVLGKKQGVSKNA